MLTFILGLAIGGGAVWYGLKRFSKETAEPDLVGQLKEEVEALTTELDQAVEARKEAVDRYAQLKAQEGEWLEKQAIEEAENAPMLEYISEEEYNELLEAGTYESESIEYYSEDGAFVDSVGEIVHNPGDIFGNDIYSTISKNETVFVRDHVKKMIYEITREEQSYSKDILGIEDPEEIEDI